MNAQDSPDVEVEQVDHDSLRYMGRSFPADTLARQRMFLERIRSPEVEPQEQPNPVLTQS